MKKFVILMTILLLISIITAIPVPESKAISVATNWMDMQGYDRVDTTQPVTVHEVYNNNITTLYVINYESDGFVIMSADDSYSPILGWSDEGNIDLDTDNPGVHYWLNSFSDEVHSIVENNLSSNETRTQWQTIGDNNYNRDLRNVDPLLPCHWNQDWPYNALCPEDSSGPGGHVYVGCVATAMAQCMRYWNYPPQGSGNHGYYASGYGYQSVNFNNSTYDWWEMPMTAGSNYDMIAKLGYDCAVSVDMMFAPDGSGAYSWEVPYALETYFSYSSSANLESRNDYSTTAWNSLLRAELDADRVIYYSGSGDDGGGGHAFVIDGYSDNDFFHFDFGWSGSGNGYYTVSNLNPSGNFNADQAAVIGIQPQNYQPMRVC
ncbi:MAG: C10 family peptidase [Candidatus Zophobacter franzmannii]|nr:C10 family peptidase [Candidatus Zophobacter franzmannii]